MEALFYLVLVSLPLVLVVSSVRGWKQILALKKRVEFLETAVQELTRRLLEFDGSRAAHPEAPVQPAAPPR